MKTLYVLVTILACTALQAEKPLLPNGDFESDPPGTITIGKMPTSWQKPYASRVMQIVSETRPGSPGKQCLKIGTSEKVKSGGAYSEHVAHDPTKGLQVWGWVKPGSQEKQLLGIYFGVGWFDSSHKPIVLVKNTTVNYIYLNKKERHGDWYRMSTSLLPAQGDKPGRFDIPPNAAYFDVRVFNLGYAAPSWFDDIEAKVMTDEEVTELVKQEEEQRKAAEKIRAQRRGPVRPPFDPRAEWLVGWKGEKQKGAEAADELARYISKVVGKTAISSEWQANESKNPFLITEVANAPEDIANALKGKRRDAFVIRYPVEFEGRKVCMMVAQDKDGYDRPVYYFLTKFMGVNWVGPGELGEVYTEQPDWKMPAKIDVLENPDFEMRHWYSPAFSCRQWLAAGVRMSFHHALGNVFHPDKHKDTPEVFPLVGGKRYIPKVKEGSHALGGWQPCTGNPKSVEIAVKHVLDSFEKNPGMATVSLSVNDGAGNICECSLCKAQDGKDAFKGEGRPDLSDRFFRFYNAVIERALEKNPNARIAVLGYGAVKEPPKEIKVHPRISVFHVMPSKEKLEAWKESGGGPNMYMWLWDGGFLTVRPDLNSLTETIRDSQRLGGIGFYSECIPHWIISAPKYYVLAHILWDTSRDPDELLDRYLKLAYGNASVHVRAYLDRWYEIYKRWPKEEHYMTSKGWRGPDQFEHLKREDFTFMDEALKKAEAEKVSEKEAKRLSYMKRYYDLMRVNGIEYLVGQELSNQVWLKDNDVSTILTAAEHATSLTPKFDELYKATVLSDETGWFLDNKYYTDPSKFYDLFVGQLRNTVSSNAATSIDGAISYVATRMMKEKSKADTIARLESEIRKRPALESFLGPQINKLKGITFPNVVVNGNFEEGEPGDPPKLPGWDFYQFYGMVKNVTAKHRWEKVGEDGRKAIGMGEGRYPEMKAIIELEAGRRYQLSFRYKSENRDRNSSFSIFSYEGDLKSASDIEADKISRFIAIPLEPTDGKWQHYKRAITPTKTGKHVLQLAVYYQKADWWGWFDDIEIRRMW